ncbi:hypothetical protein LTR85_000429 [Meristemomyces frigidus]|nr:hypothetical protein LTR85_000429 [Meristemomyces frigidus]
MQDLVDLPGDIKAYIVSCLADKADLRSVRRTCKELYQFAIAQEYQSITINEHSNLDVDLAALNPGNAGVQHIRHITITPCSYSHQCSNIDGTVIAIAQLLPQHTLFSLTYDGTRVLPASAFLTLYKRQRTLRTMRLDHISHAGILKSMSSISAGPKGPFKAADVSLCVVNTLFDDYVRGKRDLLRLRAVQISGLDLAKAAVPLLKAIDPSDLLAFGLQRCENSLDMLQALNERKTPVSLKLRSLLITEPAKETNSDIYDDALNILLRSFGMLEHLVVSVPADYAYWPDFEAIVKHANTLRFLYMDCPWPMRGGPTIVAEMKVAFEKCHRLEQLAMESPTMYLENTDMGRCHDYLGLLVSLAALPTLRSYRLLNLPENDLGMEMEDNVCYEKYVLRQLRAIADNMLSEVPKLRAMSIARGPSDEYVTRDALAFYPPFYSRGRIVDARGKEAVAAIESAEMDVLTLEPASDILGLHFDSERFLRYGYKP